MGSIYIRNVKSAIYKRLKERAKRNRRSINQEATTILEKALCEEIRAADVWKRIDRIRRRVRKRYGSFGDSTSMIRRDRRC